MMYKLPSILLLAALLGLSQCKKNDDGPPEQLPLATQTGHRAFGCLLNGKVWVPKGYNGRSNYSVSYDPTYAKGVLSVGAYRYTGKGTTDYQVLGFFSDSVQSAGVYPLTIVGHQEAIFIDNVSGCEFNQN